MQTTQEVFSASTSLAFAWLLKSGIQSNDPETAGGVHAWYDLITESYPFIYGEITGYAVNAFLFYYHHTGNPAYLHAALQAGDWLSKNKAEGSGFICNRVKPSKFVDNYYESWVFTFDQWVCVYALTNLAEKTGETFWHKAAVELAQTLISTTIKTNGSFFPAYDVCRKSAVDINDKWSRQSGGFHCKALMALERLYKMTEASQYRDISCKLLGWTLKTQQKDGRFITQNNESSTHLHPHLYTVEGLLSYGLSAGRSDALQGAKRGFEWVIQHQLSDGAFYSFFDGTKFVPFVRADILAQVLRIGSTLISNGIMTGIAASLDKLRTALLHYQILNGPQSGGFLYGREQDGTIRHHANAWVTMFAAQALGIHDTFSYSPPYNMNFFI